MTTMDEAVLGVTIAGIKSICVYHAPGGDQIEKRVNHRKPTSIRTTDEYLIVTTSNRKETVAYYYQLTRVSYFEIKGEPLPRETE